MIIVGLWCYGLWHHTVWLVITTTFQKTWCLQPEGQS